MKATTQPFRLLTVRRIADLTERPVSDIRHVLDEHPDIRPTAIADYRPVYDRDAFLKLLSIIDQWDAKQGEATSCS